MKNLYLNTSNDLEIRNYNLRITAGYAQFLSQKIKNRLSTFYGEFFANERIGLPYFQSILGKGVDPSQISTLFKEEILAVPGVDALLKFEIEYTTDTRELSISFAVTATDGTAIEDGVII